MVVLQIIVFELGRNFKHWFGGGLSFSHEGVFVFKIMKTKTAIFTIRFDLKLGVKH